MIEDRFNSILEAILDSNFVDGEMIKVAEISSPEGPGVNSKRVQNTALVSKNLFNRIKPSHVNPWIHSTNKSFSEKDKYRGKFYLFLTKTIGLKQVEPLAVSWTSGNHTILEPDQAFLDFHQLVPRYDTDKVYWDDLSRPKESIVMVNPVAFYDFPYYPKPSTVFINSDYLYSYLKQRGKVAVQVFQEIRWIESSKELESMVNSKGYCIHEFGNVEIRINIQNKIDGKAHIEINGFRVLLDPFIEESQLSYDDLIWPGVGKYEGKFQITDTLDIKYAYVSDTVLDKYEKSSNVHVSVEYGSIDYGVHWAVTHCNRVGKNAIQVDLKKLYEGTPYEIIDYWNTYAIHPDKIDYNDKSIAEKSQTLVRVYLSFARMLSSLLNRVVDFNIYPEKIVAFDQGALDNYTIYDHPIVDAITHHIDYEQFSKDQFMSRCAKLDKLLVEGLNYNMSTFRKTAQFLELYDGVVKKEWGCLKTLDKILNFFYEAHVQGLNPKTDSKIIIDNLKANKPISPLNELFALNDIRNLHSHRKENLNVGLNDALVRFEISPKSILDNYAVCTSTIYSCLIDMFYRLNGSMNSWYDFE